MSERRLSTDGIERRGFLSAVAVGLGTAPLDSVTADSSDSSDPTYVVEQGDRCLPVVALSGDETVEEFYDYRTPNTDPSGDAYASYGTTDLQRSDASVLFLYDGPEGLSLVAVHDELEDGTNGGAVTFRLEGHTDGEWVVGDDDYDASTNYDSFEETDDGWRVDWTWNTGRTDGGAYRPLGDEFAVTVDPAFNEDAELYGDHYEGEITDWQLLSGDRSDPERRSLSLTEPITIRTGGCDGAAVGGDAEGDASAGTVSADVAIAQGRVNPRSRGALPVVVRSTAGFDATAVDPETVEFGPAGAPPEQSSRADVNGDGRADLLLKFRLPATGIDWDTDAASLSAETRDGRSVEGTAEVRLVPRRGENDEDDGGDGDDDGNGRGNEKGDETRNSEGEGGNDDDDDDREKKEEKLEEKREEMEEKWEEKEEKLEEKREEMEEKRERKEEKWEEEKEEMEEKWEKKKEKWEKERDDEDDD